MAEFGDREDVILEAHIGGGPPQWYDYRPSHEPLLEVASGHGCFEWVLSGPCAVAFAQPLLDRGTPTLLRWALQSPPKTTSGGGTILV